MTFLEKIKGRKTTISFELFPPKRPDGWANLYSTLADISKLSPDLVSVTYGAGGSTREKTIDLVVRVKYELEIEPMAHLACVSHTRDELEIILNRLRDTDIRYILAIRGDPQDRTIHHTGGFSYASELIKFIKGRYNFTIGCATYPERHPESRDIDEDIKYLKIKQEMGASFAITQLFFINENFYRFRDKSLRSGINIPIIAGIMPIINLNQIERFRTMCGCILPDSLVNNLKDNPEETSKIGTEYTINQCIDLIRNEVAGLHFFTLNRSISVVSIVNEVKKFLKTNCN